MSNTSSNANFVIPVPAIPSVAVDGTAARFPVRRIFCVGRNYVAHAREMGRDPDREPPFFFLKPSDAVVDNGPHCRSAMLRCSGNGPELVFRRVSGLEPILKLPSVCDLIAVHFECRQPVG